MSHERTRDVACSAPPNTDFVDRRRGRRRPQARIDDGRITWSDDAEWGERLARNLAYTM